MSAAELLRGLDKDATAPRWEVEDNGDGYITGHITAEAHRYCGNAVERRDSVCAPSSLTIADARCIASTRNLLPLLAALVEAVEAWGERCVVSAGHRITTLERDQLKTILGALYALNAAAAKEAN